MEINIKHLGHYTSIDTARTQKNPIATVHTCPTPSSHPSFNQKNSWSFLIPPKKKQLEHPNKVRKLSVQLDLLLIILRLLLRKVCRLDVHSQLFGFEKKNRSLDLWTGLLRPFKREGTFWWIMLCNMSANGLRFLRKCLRFAKEELIGGFSQILIQHLSLDRILGGHTLTHVLSHSF